MASQTHNHTLSVGLRLAGLWLIWSAWCSVSGWLLSALGLLDGVGYAILLPVFIIFARAWLRSTAPKSIVPCANPVRKFVRRMQHPAPLIYLCIVVLSLVGGCLYAPWDFDSATYRLPRVLYWWQAHHWYWISSVDHRLNYSSAGFEWQLLPLMILFRSDRLLFLVNWIPFLLMPGLVFSAYRSLGINTRSARRWMWLLPSGYCYALQCSGLENDGYVVNFLLAAVAFAGMAYRTGWLPAFWLALLASGLMTGAKLSNVPLLLPLAVLLMAAMGRTKWFNWRLALVGVIAILSSCIPLAVLSWQRTGDWTGDPADQWHVHAHRPVGAALVNVLVLGQDATQPPLFPASSHLNALLAPLNQSAVVHWLAQCHGDFTQFRYGTIASAATAGPGFSLGIYCLFLMVGCVLLRSRAAWANAPGNSLPLSWRIAPILAWVAYGVLLCKLGSVQSPRIAAPYYPLLLVCLLRSPRVVILERKKGFALLACLASATACIVIVLMQSRPLVPIQTIARVLHSSALNKIAADYRVWDEMRDDLAPLRAQLPPDASRLGYGGGLSDTPYGLFKPLGSREIVELRSRWGTGWLEKSDWQYAVVTDRGLQERYSMDLKTWLDHVGGQIIFTFNRKVTMDAHSTPFDELWYLVKLPPADGHS